MAVKRLYLLMLALVMALAISACGTQQPAADSGSSSGGDSQAAEEQASTSGGGEETTLRMWIWSQWNGETGIEADGQPLDWWKARVAEWEAEHLGVTVEIEDLNGQDLDINAKYDTAVAAGNIADIVWVDESYFSKYASADVLEPIDNYLTEADREDFLAKNLELSRLNGKQWF